MRNVGGCGAPGMRDVPRIGERRRAVGEGRPHARVQRVVGLEVEVAGDDVAAGRGERGVRAAVVVADPRIAGVAVALGVDRAQRLDLRRALA